MTSHDLRWLSVTIRELYSVESLPALCTAVVESLYPQFRALAVAVEELGNDGCSYLLHGGRLATAPPSGYESCIHDHPAIPHIIDPLHRLPVVHLASLPRFGAWDQTDHYHGLAKPMGWKDQLILLGRGRTAVGACDLMRDIPFSPSEFGLVQALQPHFAAAWSRVRPHRSHVSDDTAPTHLHLDRSGVASMTPKQRLLLRAYFPEWRDGPALPDRVRLWVRGSQERLDRGPPLPPLRPLAAESARGRLMIRYFPAGSGSPAQLKLLELPAYPDFFALKARGLTGRECEVLAWIADGKRDAEIALILHCSRATVSKHTERIRAKLGVETRSGAAAEAYRILTH